MSASTSTAADLPVEVAVLGAGGAGLLASIAAAWAGARTVVYERNAKPARKVAISGGGRCNFSNTLDPRGFVKLFGDEHAKLLGHALRAFSNQDLIKMLSARGVEGEIERHYRLYTKSGRGQDVVDALVAELHAAGGELISGAHVTGLERDAASGLFRLSMAQGTPPVLARTAVVCTGGLSYPATGSTGAGYTWAREMGHGVTDLNPALVGLLIAEPWTRKLAGLAWDDATVELWPLPSTAPGAPAEKRTSKISSERAEILFTHFGISGPAVIDTSNAFVRSGLKSARLTIDFFPDKSTEQLDAELLRRFKQQPGSTPAVALKGLLPARLLEHFVSELFRDAQTYVSKLPKAGRTQLLEAFKGTALTVAGTRGMEFGEVTAGGLAWTDLDPTTLESRRVPGLFFAGEILDLTGRCGGFNLQAAFSTGYLAGAQAAARARSKA